VKRWNVLEKLESDVRELGKYCALVRQRLVRRPEEAPASLDGVAAPGAASATAAFILLLVFAQASWAQTRGEVWIDRSESTFAAGVEQTVETAFTVLPRLAEAGVRQWDLYGFAGKAFSAKPFNSMILPPLSSSGCLAPPPEFEIDRIFRNTAHAATARQEKLCDDQRQAELRKYHAAVNNALQSARAGLSGLTAEAPHRTCLVELLSRVSDPRLDPPRYVLIVTDGEETCEPRIHAALPAPAAPVSAVMVIVPEKTPKNGRTPRQHLSAVEEYWRRVAPWVQIVPSFAVNEKVLRAAMEHVKRIP
jgi:hypothetical protein